MKPRLPFAAYGVVPSIPTSWNVAGRVSDCSPFGAARVLPCRVEGRACRKARPSAAPPHRSERSRIESAPPAVRATQSGLCMARTPARPVGAEFGSRPSGRLPAFRAAGTLAADAPESSALLLAEERSNGLRQVGLAGI